MSQTSRAVSHNHVLSTSLPPSQPLHPVTRMRNQNSAHRRCPSSPLETSALLLTARICQTCHHESLFTASTHVTLAGMTFHAFQAREPSAQRLNPSSCSANSIRGGGNPVLQPDIAPGGTRNVGIARQQRGRGRQGYASPTRIFSLIRGVRLGHPSGSGKSLRIFAGLSCLGWRVLFLGEE